MHQKGIETSESSKEFTCPTCSTTCVLPDNGVEGLSRDLRLEFRAQSMEFIIKLAKPESIQCDNCESKIPKEQTASFCCDCRQFLCKRCADFHLISKLTKKHFMVNTANKNAKEDILNNIKPPELRYCMVPRHYMQSLALDFYCVTCKELVCHSCLLASHRDADHEYMSLRDVAKQHVEEMQALLGQADDASSQLKDAKQRSEKMIGQVKTSKNQVRSNIEKEFKKIEDALKIRKEHLLHDTEDIATVKLSCLNRQKEKFVKLQQRIQCYMDAIKMTVTYQDEEVVAFKRMLQTELDKILKEFECLSLRLDESEAIPTLLDPATVTDEIGKYGEIKAGSSPEKAKVYLHMSRAVKGKPRKIVVRVFDESGQPFEFGGEDIKGELKLPGSEGKVEELGEYMEKGVYVVSLIPMEVGMNELVVTVRNRPIQASPFPILVREARNWDDLPEKMSDGVPSSVFGANVNDLAMHANGTLFVSQDSCVRVIDPTDNSLKKTIGDGRGSGDRNFYYPQAIAISGDRLYVADSNNHRIQIIQAVGEYKFERKPFGSNGTGDGQLSQPRGICLDNDGKIYVADQNNHRVVVFENDGTFFRNIKPENDQIKKPWGIAFDPLGNLHVVCHETNSRKVCIISPEEDKVIGTYGEEDLISPTGITIDEEGYAFVVERNSTNSRLLVFDPKCNYKFMKSVTGFDYSEGVVISEDGTVFVGDHNSKCVRKCIVQEKQQEAVAVVEQ